MNVDVQSEIWAAIQNSGHIGEIAGGRYGDHPDMYGDGVYSIPAPILSICRAEWWIR